MHIVDTEDSLTIGNWYLSDWMHIEIFKLANGKILLVNQVNTLVDAMAQLAPPAVGETMLATNHLTTLQPVIAASWH